mmetsp:Transcript_24000/g.71991  ORF Transcript_24000/g.71991 Transcript_24000/m.71991 type:complete len:262 (+) Transcript_24000:353-1138(+)
MATAQPQSMVLLRFVGCDEIARAVRRKLDKGEADAVQLVPDGASGEEQSERPRNFVAKDFRLEVDGRAYPARLVNLPTIVETHKTWDRATYYKCGDVGQAMLVFPDAAARAADAARGEQYKGTAWASLHPDGATPPAREVVRRRFARARKRARAEYPRDEVASVEAEMIKLLEAGAAEGPPPPAPPVEDVVRFEPWMVDARGEGVNVSEDNPLAARHPWILMSAEDLAPAPAPAPAPKPAAPVADAGFDAQAALKARKTKK